MIFLYLFTIFFLTTNILIGQDQEYIFINVTKNAYLSQHYVSDILEDDNGIMWFGTHDGLNYFDGYSFKRYTRKLKDKNSLTSNFITSLEKDEQGNLWIGTNDGLNKLDLKTETFYTFKKDTSSYSLEDNYIVDIRYDKKGFLWVATRYDGLYKLDLKTEKFTKVLRNNSIINFNFLLGIKEIELDKDGDIWVLYEAKGIVFYSPLKQTFEIFSSNQDSKILFNNANSMGITDDNIVIFDIWNFGLVSLDKKDFSVDKNFIKDLDYKHFQNEYSANANDIIISKNGTIYFDNSNIGLLRYDIKKQKFDYSNEFVYIAEDSLDKYTSKLYIDSRNNLWVGSAGFGIGLLTKNIKPFITYSSEVKSKKFKLSFPSIRTIYEDSNGDLYIGGYNGFNKVNKTTGIIEIISSDPTYSIGKDIFDSDDYLTVSFESFDYGGTLYRFNKKNKTFQKLFNEVKSNFVRCFLKDSQSRLWIGMMRGLFIYDLEKSQIIPFKTDSFDFSNEIINQIYEDRKSNIWIPTRGKGVFFYNKENNLWISIMKDSENYSGLNSNNIFKVFEDSRNNLWICSNSGLHLFNQKTNSFTVFTEEDGLPNNVVYSIIEDNQGYYWLSTNFGISRFDLINKEFWNFDIRDGIACNEKNFNASFKGRDGKIYFGGIAGLTVFNPINFNRNINAPKILLTELRIFPDIGKKGKLYNAYTNKIELQPNQKTLLLEFASISDYANDIKSRYRYKIVELNNEWIDVGFKREITLANLSHGEYRLLVSSSNNDGVWTISPLELSIVVLPEFYQTTWFRIILILLGISFIAAFFIVRIKFLKQSNIKLEKLVKERTLELEESKKDLEIANSTKNKFFSIIAHDLKNPFNALINYSDILLTEFNELNNEEKKNFIAGIKDSSESTFRFLQNLLTWARTQTINIKCTPKSIDLKKIVHDCFNVLDVISKNKNLRLISSIEEKKLVFADENMLNTIFMNLLTNAIKFSPEGSSIFVGIDKEDNDSITVFVKDEGIGISESEVQKLFKIDEYQSSKGTKGETGTGLGLIITYEFIKANKGKIFVESKLGEGTTFFITLQKPSKDS